MTRVVLTFKKKKNESDSYETRVKVQPSTRASEQEEKAEQEKKAKQEEKKDAKNEEEEFEGMSGFNFEALADADKVVDKTRVRVQLSTKAAEQEEKKS